VGHHAHLHAPVEGAAAARSVRRVFIITLVLNLVVAVTKGLYGYFSGSIALGTDAIHAVLDGSSNVLALMSLHWSTAPADARHPYGHRKIEILAALGIGVLIVIGLFELTAAAVRSLLSQHPAPTVGWAGFVVVAATMAINLFIVRYEEKSGHELGSPLLCADAQHTRSDLYASTAVALSFIGVRLGWRWADPVGAMFVVLLVGRAAWLVFRDNIPTLIDAAVLDPARVATLAGAIPGVGAVSRVRSRGLRNAVHLDLHVAVDATMSIRDAHHLAETIEAALRAAYPELSDVVIHTGPSEATSDAPAEVNIRATHT
jgi:cation diffusion facilitator family transporter